MPNLLKLSAYFKVATLMVLEKQFKHWEDNIEQNEASNFEQHQTLIASLSVNTVLESLL